MSKNELSVVMFEILCSIHSIASIQSALMNSVWACLKLILVFYYMQLKWMSSRCILNCSAFSIQICTHKFGQ